MVLTGGPGTGKTTTILAIINIFEKMGAKTVLAAPTGRAAKRMSEASGREAGTIHRLLEYKPPEGYKKNSDNLLECDVLIIDETSMVDVILMYNLLKAVPDQAVSTIITNAHRINKGMMPVLKNGSKSDFFFMEEEDPQKVADTIMELCKSRLPRYYKVDPVHDIQVLCPMQRGETGAFNLNQMLQEALNPSQISIKYGGSVFKLGDKVMQVKNNYDKNVFHGDIGTVTDINNEDRTLMLEFDGNKVLYDATELDEVVLAYAATVHKSQGSEYKVVVAPFTMQHYVMLQRNLLYTCITRAKKILVLVGAKKAVQICVSNNNTQKRNTMLAERLKVQND